MLVWGWGVCSESHFAINTTATIIVDAAPNADMTGMANSIYSSRASLPATSYIVQLVTSGNERDSLRISSLGRVKISASPAPAATTSMAAAIYPSCV